MPPRPSPAGLRRDPPATGARVALNYSSDRDGVERVSQKRSYTGGEAIVVGADVSNAADVARLFAEVDAAFGGVDVFVNNAGIFRVGAFMAPFSTRKESAWITGQIIRAASGVVVPAYPESRAIPIRTGAT